MGVREVVLIRDIHALKCGAGCRCVNCQNFSKHSLNRVLQPTTKWKKSYRVTAVCERYSSDLVDDLDGANASSDHDEEELSDNDI